MPAQSQRNLTPFNHSTPITTSLVLALCAGAYWVGSETSSLQANVQQNSKAIEVNEDWKRETQKLLREMSDISRDNKRRLDLAEQRIER